MQQTSYGLLEMKEKHGFEHRLHFSRVRGPKYLEFTVETHLRKSPFCDPNCIRLSKSCQKYKKTARIGKGGLKGKLGNPTSTWTVNFQ